MTEVEETIICLLRKELWISREEIVEVVAEQGIMVCVATVYRSLERNGLNRKPESVKAVYGTFKEYRPGYLHIDVTYFPKIEGVRRYLFIAIDRATRLLFYRLYDEKSAENAADFLSLCRDFFPFEITTVLTDNGINAVPQLFVRNILQFGDLTVPLHHNCSLEQQ